MIHPVPPKTQVRAKLTPSDWLKLGLITAAVSILAVIAVQALAISLWPEIALFAPLDNYVRSAIFTLVPALGATVLLAWLAERRVRPVQTFITISVIVLMISIIPDYFLSVPHKTLLASSVAAFLHGVAGVITVFLLVVGYQWRTGQT
jgi:hypothetical protein